jgi:ribosome-binding factor A
MAGFRPERVAQLLQEAITEMLQRGHIKDPRVGQATVAEVRVTTDLRIAKVYVQAIGGAEERENTVKGLQNAEGWIRRELRPLLSLKSVPELLFRADDTAEKADRVLGLLAQLNQQKSPAPPPPLEIEEPEDDDIVEDDELEASGESEAEAEVEEEPEAEAPEYIRESDFEEPVKTPPKTVTKAAAKPKAKAKAKPAAKPKAKAKAKPASAKPAKKPAKKPTKKPAKKTAKKPAKKTATKKKKK